MLYISDAIEAGIEMIEDSKWRRSNHTARKNGWDRWHQEHHPALNLWNDLQPGHIFEFHQWLRARYRPATTNNYINPIRKAATWVKLYKPELAKELFVRNVIRAKHKPVAKRYLMADQLAAAVGAARDAGEPALVAALMFGGLAGLDIGEILRITRNDIQKDRGILLIRGEKNDYRPRVVPMCEPLAQFAGAWASLYSRMPVKTDGALSHKARAVLNRCAKETSDETFSMVTLHDSTRVTFVNMALQAGAESEYVKAYIGHAPESIMSKHYGDLTPRKEDMPRVKNAKLEQLSSRVVLAIDKKMQGVSFFD